MLVWHCYCFNRGGSKIYKSFKKINITTKHNKLYKIHEKIKKIIGQKLLCWAKRLELAGFLLTVSKINHETFKNTENLQI